jgi:hypothetical protein
MASTTAARWEVESALAVLLDQGDTIQDILDFVGALLDGWQAEADAEAKDDADG